MQDTDLSRFNAARHSAYPQALSEIRQGKKRGHWMWYVFPQLSGLGYSEASRYFALKDTGEAAAYIAHPVLGPRLIEICNALLQLPGNDAHYIFGSPDDVKLCSCMTLFTGLKNANSVFEAVLKKFFTGKKDEKTLRLLSVAK